MKTPIPVHVAVPLGEAVHNVFDDLMLGLAEEDVRPAVIRQLRANDVIEDNFLMCVDRLDEFILSRIRDRELIQVVEGGRVRVVQEFDYRRRHTT